MALTYEQSAALMKDPTFTSRVKVACMKYADYIMLEATNTPAHATRLRWANLTFQNPDQAAAAVVSTVVMDPAVQGPGSAIDDAALQAATEVAINTLM